MREARSAHVSVDDLDGEMISMNSVTGLWILFAVLFLVVSALDLFVVTHRHSPVGVKSALRWTATWVSVAFGFAGAVAWFHPGGSDVAMLFVAGYLTEYSLSVDNLFVFILIFSLMGVREVAQPKLIKLGIYLSIVLRIGFIAFGIALVQRFHVLLYVFGGLLIWTAWKMLMSDGDEQVHPEKNLLSRFAARVFPLRVEGPDSTRLFTRHEGRLAITPLFLVFLVIGSTDILFALDSIPAIMGISEDPFVVITSNVFAVLGLNALFFAVRGVMQLFRFLKHGVSIILFFIGGKMVAGVFPPVEEWFKHHTFVSLTVIAAVLAASIAVSVWRPSEPGKPGARPE